MDLIAYALAKKYTDKSIEGGGAVKGKNCTISSIEPIEGGNRVTFQWTLDNGVIETETMDVMDGEDGADGSQVTESDTNGNIVVDGTEIQVYDDTEVKDAISDIDDIITTDETTVEGNPINFSTKSAQTAQSTIIDLEPIQDLHGYDKPWVGGAGKNKLDASDKLNFTNNFILGTNSSTQSITLDAGTYTFSFKVTGTPSANAAFLLDDWTSGSSVRLGSGSVVSGRNTLSFTLTETVTAIKAFCNTANVIDITELQIEKSASFTSYEPYTNICPISGRTEIGILGCGKNLCDTSLAEIGTAWNGANNSARARLVLPIEPNTKYTLKVNGSMTVSNVYAKSTSIVPANDSGSDITSSKQVTWTSASTDKYLVIAFSKTAISQDDIDGLQLQLEKDETPTTYSPYTKSNDLTINLGQTVYGGTLDVENGVLTVDRYLQDLGAFDWSKSSVRFYKEFLYDNPNIPYAPLDDTSYIADDYCSQYAFTSRSNIENVLYGISIHKSGTSVYITVRDERYDSATTTDFKTAMDGVQLCYTLATPITIQLTPHEISLLRGVNYISTDGDKITLTYRDGKVATLGDLTSAVDNLDSKIDESKILTDTVTGTKYKLVVTDGVLGIEEVTEPNTLLSSPALLGSSTPENDSSNETDTEDNNTEEV